MAAHPAANLQRVGFLVAVPPILTKLNVDAASVIQASGLAPDALDNPEGTIPYRSMGLLLECAAKMSACPHFGILLGKVIRIESLGLLGKWISNMPTLREATRAYVENQHRQAHGSVMYLLEEPKRALLGYAIYEPDMPGTQLIIDIAATAMSQLISELLRQNQPSFEVMLSRRMPADLSPYREVFGERVRFDAKQTAIVLPRYLLDSSVPGADPERLASLDAQVRDHWNAGELDIATRLSRELKIAIFNGRLSVEEVAAQMGMSTRTFRRRLEEAGISFREAIDESRFELAKQLFTNTDLNASRISAILGYSNPAVLTRSFTRWARLSPKAWRSAPKEGFSSTPSQ